jgi:ABC-2 type transport system ATP-binding protein
MITADNVHMHFRRGLIGPRIHALDGLSLEVREGDFFALVGQNGAGKSTAMYCFLGLLKPTLGKIEVMGHRPELGSPLYASVAYLPEEPHYHLYLTVEEATRYYASLYGHRPGAKAIDDLLGRLGLGPFRKMRLAKCSKGMKQKVGIAQCLIRETRLLFLDEPTRGLDPIIVREFREILRELHRRGATVVMNSHVLSEVEMLANRVAIIGKGKVIVQDDLQTLMTLNQDIYSVRVEAKGNMPEYLKVIDRQGDAVRGTIPAGQLFAFMDYLRQEGLRVLDCSLQRTSLEDSFVRILKGDAANEKKEV